MSRARPRRPSRRAPPPGLAEEERPFVHDEILHGIDAKKVKGLIDRGVLGAKQVFRVIPERTFNRRLAKREALKVPEADAIGRLLRVTEAAKKTFGDADFATKFLNLPNPALKNRIPMEMAKTDAGAREVEAILLHIAYGDYT
ncbi:MAG: antitoxin Xre/MbcA/ParS toxin-binding domain-containing protein [Xanthobacteraceae bacterium]|jgi:putative toxin-antitoxin system antitoxin component (TIGR02293 family)